MSLKGKSASPDSGGRTPAGEPDASSDRIKELERSLARRIDRADWLSDELGRKQAQLGQTEVQLAQISARADAADQELARAAGRAEAMSEEIVRRRTETLQISAELAHLADRVARAEREAEAQTQLASRTSREASALKASLDEARKQSAMAAHATAVISDSVPKSTATPPGESAAPPLARPAGKRSLKARLGPFAILAAPLLLFRPRKKGAAKQPAPVGLKPPRTDREAMEMIAGSDLFDPQWYLEKYRDVREAGMAPLEHYFRHGGLEGRKPGPVFDSRWYMEQAPDTVTTGTNPLVHFLTVGRSRGIALPDGGATPLHEQPEVMALLASPLFDADWYRARQPGLPKGREHVASHYLHEGWKIGLNPGPGFDGELYLRRHEDVKAAGMNPFLHYVRHGREEGREAFAVVGESAGALRAASAWARSAPAAPPPTIDPETDADTASQPQVEWRWSKAADLPALTGEDNGLWLADLPLGRVALSDGPVEAVVTSFMALTGLKAAPGSYAPLFETSDARLILDGWFLTDRDLRLRLGAGSGPCVIRGYQVDLQTGTPRLLAESALDRRDFAIADFPLLNAFSPVLLCLDDGRGLVQEAAILAFPSLARNGLHHGELVAQGWPDALWAQGARLATELLRDDGPPLAVTGLEIDLDGTIGGEAGFGRDFRLWLAGVMGMSLTPVSTTTDLRTDALRTALQATVTPAAGISRAPRKGGLVLLLPGDAVPTLAALTSRDLQTASKTGEPVPFVVADVVRSRPRWFLSPPPRGDYLLDYQPRHGGVAWPALRRPARSGPAPTSAVARPHPPVAIRFTEDLPSGADTRKVFPMAADITEPLLHKAPPARAPRITVVMDIPASTTTEDVILSLESVARQDFDGAVDLVVALPAERPDIVAVAKASAITRTRAIVEPGPTATRLKAAVAQAQGRFLLFLQPGVMLQDRRTLKTLLTIAAHPEVASAGCATVRQSNDAGFGQKLTLHSGGTFPDQISFTTAPRLTFSEGVAATALPATTYAVACNRFRLALVPRPVWDALEGEDAGVPGDDHDLDFALRALRAGFGHVCTSIVAATISDRLPPVRGATVWTDTLSLDEWSSVLSRMTLVRALT